MVAARDKAQIDPCQIYHPKRRRDSQNAFLIIINSSERTFTLALSGGWASGSFVSSSLGLNGDQLWPAKGTEGVSGVPHHTPCPTLQPGVRLKVTTVNLGVFCPVPGSARLPLIPLPGGQGSQVSADSDLR